MRGLALGVLVVSSSVVASAADAPRTVLRGGTVYDGTGAPARVADVAIRGDRVEAVGAVAALPGDVVVDVRGLAVAPGFVNMLSWSTESLLVDGRSQGEIRQGVTTQIFGEGSSMGPLTDAMKRQMKADQGDLKYDIPWTTLAEYLQHLEKKGVAQNVASYIGAATIREHVVGLDDRAPTAAELDADARPGRAGDGGGRPRHRLVADLRAGDVREDRGADRALQGRGALPGQVHLAPAQRGRPPAGGGRRADPHQPRGRAARRDLPPEGGGRGQLAEDGPGDRARRGGAKGRARDHGGHVHLHRGRDRLRRLRAALVAGRRRGASSGSAWACPRRARGS